MRYHTTVGVTLQILGLAAAVSLSALEFETLDEPVRTRLLAGEAVLLGKRPDETSAVDERFVTLSRIVEGTQREIWDVIHDKEDAEKFVDGVLESKVIEASETEILVEQKTRVGGPKGAYYYQLRHTLTPYTRSDFTFVTGEMRDISGTWWILAGPEPGRCLVIYSLYIDPGRFAPRFIVQRGMKKSMPGTIESMQREVLRRRESAGNETE